MGKLLILVPTSLANFAVSRGTGGENLLRPDPKEVWLDSAVGTAATIDLDLGAATAIDTVFLGCIWNAHADASWTITGGVAGYAEVVLKAAGALRVPERAGRRSPFTHAFWHGDDALVRYLRISITQPAGQPAISVGALMVGQAFVPSYNQEWGAGRSVKDTSVVARLPSGSVATVEGARYGSYKFSLGDLTTDEADYLYELQLDRGESRRLLVVEDPDQTTGLRNRLHYGLLSGLRPFERRNPAQTRWEFQVDDLVTEGNTLVETIATPAVTLSGDPISFGGEILTIGA